MATLVTPTNLQKVEFNVTTAEGDSRVTTVTGKIPMTVKALASFSQGNVQESFKVLVDPSLKAVQFRRATAIASFAGTAISATPAAWHILDAQATFDDETERVQLVVDVQATQLNGFGSTTEVNSLWFQVTTLAVV